MTAPRSQARQKPRGKNLRWPKTYLLPMPDETVRELSLAAHLALIGCTRGAGSQHLLNELIRTTYLSFLMLKQGYGQTTIEVFRVAESVLDRAVLNAERSGGWRLDCDDVGAIKSVLCVFDEQISTVSTKVFAEAHAALSRLLGKTHTVSPIASYQ